jgi:hypothetical protein
LGDFLPHEIGVNLETLRMTRQVIRTFEIWMVEKGYLRDKEAAGDHDGG